MPTTITPTALDTAAMAASAPTRIPALPTVFTWRRRMLVVLVTLGLAAGVCANSAASASAMPPACPTKVCY